MFFLILEKVASKQWSGKFGHGIELKENDKTSIYSLDKEMLRVIDF